MKKILIEDFKQNRLNIIILIILSIFISTCEVLKAVCLSKIIDVTYEGDSTLLIIMAVLNISFCLLDPCLNGVNIYYKAKIREATNEYLKGKILEHIEKIPIIDLKKYHTGDLMTRLTSDIENVSKIMPNTVISLYKGIVVVILSIIYTIYLNWKMALIIFLVSPVIILWGKIMMPISRKAYQVQQNEESNVRSFLQEQLQNIIVIKCFNLYKASKEKFKKINDNKINKALKYVFINEITDCGSEIIGAISLVCCISIGCYYVLKGNMTIGEVMGFVQVLNYIVWPFTGMIQIISVFETQKASVKRLEELVCILEEDTLHNEMIKEITEEEKIELVIKDVCFEYESSKSVFKNMNLILESGTMIGIIGRSGCGKSTLVKLILALYQHQKGKIYINYKSKKISGVNMRNFIAYVPQEQSLIKGTIEENIKYGNEDASEEEVIDVAKRAYIHDFISTLPNGYQTELQENGMGISIGQAQRISLARALLKKSLIIILDEPTAALDQESEICILDTLQAESKKKMCIMVAHSKMAYMQCEKIILVGEDGNCKDISETLLEEDSSLKESLI